MSLKDRALRAVVIVAFVLICWLILQGFVVQPLKWIAANYTLWHVAAGSLTIIVVAVLADRWMDKRALRRRQQLEDQWPLQIDLRNPSGDKRPPDQA